MKSFKLTIIILFFLSMESVGQLREKPPNTLYLSYQPADHGLGVRGDYHINHWAGVYSSGSYSKWGIYQNSGLGDHVKLTAGILIPYKEWMNNKYDFTLGLNYHWVSGQVIKNGVFNGNPVFNQPWSFEIGLTVKVRRFALGMRTDILRWEPCIDLGIPLN